MLNKYHVIPQQIGDRKAAEFWCAYQRITNITLLLYHQRLSLTIKGYSPITNLYLLDIPNKEVRLAWWKFISVICTSTHDGWLPRWFAVRGYLRREIGWWAALLQTFLSTIPCCDNTWLWRPLPPLLYTIFSLLVCMWMWKCAPARSWWCGDVQFVRLFMWLNWSWQTPMPLDQINLKNYPERFALCGLPVPRSDFG